jgi:kynurenine formamidase
MLRGFMRFIDLTHPLRDGLPGFPSDPQLRVEPYLTMQRTSCNLSRISMGSHQGTHVDAMWHFVADGKRIDEMPLSWFYGPARVIKIPKEAREEITVDDLFKHQAMLRPASRVIFNTGWHREYGTARFFEDYPSMTIEAAQYLASRKLRMIGMDMPTPGRDFYEIHHTLLAKEVEMVIVESLANLDAVPDTFTFIGFPLHFAGLDGSPIRAVAMVA